MTLIAEDDTRAVLARLKDAIYAGGYSLRGLAVDAMQRMTARELDEVLSELGERLAHHRGTVALRKKLAGEWLGG